MITWHDSDFEPEAVAVFAQHSSVEDVKVDEKDKPPSPQFPICEKWNKCIAICQGTGLEVPCDALVRATDENLAITLQEPQSLVEQAGPVLRDELSRLGECPTGDVRVTGAFQLRFLKHIIHAVPPLYSDRFRTASLSCLHSTYKNVLNNAIELQVRSLIIPPMFVIPGGFPLEESCHLVLRTFRRYFDHFGPDPFLDFIVLSCPNNDMSTFYRKILPVYFPRNTAEERLSLLCKIAAEDDGFGGPLIKERYLPIKILVPDEEESEGYHGDSSSRSASVLGKVSEPPSDYRRVQKIRKNERKNSSSHGKASSSSSNNNFFLPNSSNTASPLVERSLKIDLTSLVASGFLSVVGTDKLGRHVVVMVAKELDLRKFDINQVLFYFVRVLEPIVSYSSSDFVIVYCHTLAGKHTMTGEQAGALVKALNENDKRYLPKLSALYILHADWRTRLNLAYSRVAHLPGEIGDRIVTVNCCRSFVDLLLPITPRPGSSTSNGMDTLLPDFVVDFDNKDHEIHRG